MLIYALILLCVFVALVTIGHIALQKSSNTQNAAAVPKPATTPTAPAAPVPHTVTTAAYAPTQPTQRSAASKPAPRRRSAPRSPNKAPQKALRNASTSTVYPTEPPANTLSDVDFLQPADDDFQVLDDSCLNFDVPDYMNINHDSMDESNFNVDGSGNDEDI